MNSDDFFKKVDENISKDNAESATADEERRNRKKFLQEVILNLKPIAENYAEELVMRGVSVDVSINAYGIIFSMKKKGTNYEHTLIMGEDKAFNGYITFECNSTNDDGRRYTSTNGVTYSQKNWSEDVFTTILQKEIEHYFYYSKRHV